MKKQLLMTLSFQKYLKKVRRHFSEDDIQMNLQEFLRLGFRKGESTLKAMRYGNLTIKIVKLRIRVAQAIGRYLVGIINEHEYLPIFLDLKTGVYGRNLSFDAFQSVLTDYLEHTEEQPRLKRFDLA